MLSQARKGELAACGSAFLWSLFPVLTVITVSIIPPLFTAALATGFSAFFFTCVLIWKGNWSEIKIHTAWMDIFLATLFIGIVYYGLVFVGYKFTSPGNGAIVALMEVFFTFLIVNLLWKHEQFIPLHGLGAFLMVVGALFVLLPKHTYSWNRGDILILLATVFAPIGNIYAQKARRKVSAETVMFFRSILSTVFFIVLAMLLEPFPTFAEINSSFWYLLLSGIFLLGISKILWLEAIHRIPITKTIALTEVEVVLTLVFAYFLLGQKITLEQAMGAFPMMIGIWLFMRKGPLRGNL